MAKIGFPEAWHKPEVSAALRRTLDVSLSGLELLQLHTHLWLALQHPKIVGPSRGVTVTMLYRIELLLESLGVPAPPDGWRETYPFPPE